MSNPKVDIKRSLELDIKSLPLDFLRELFSNETPASLRLHPWFPWQSRWPDQMLSPMLFGAILEPQ